MSKYIDKNKVLEYIIFGVVGKDITCGELKRGIESLPTIEVSEGYTEFIEWLVEVVLNDEDWELNAIAYGEIIARKLKKLGLLEVEDGYYVRANVTPTERTGEWRENELGLFCSACGNSFACSETDVDEMKREFHFCSNCGAKMGGDTEVKNMVRCYARTCKNNKNGKCTANNIILEFGCDNYDGRC